MTAQIDASDSETDSSDAGAFDSDKWPGSLRRGDLLREAIGENGLFGAVRPGHGTADSPDAGEQEGWYVPEGEMLKHGYEKRCPLVVA